MSHYSNRVDTNDIDREISAELWSAPSDNDRSIIHAAVARGVTVRNAARAIGLPVIARWGDPDTTEQDVMS